jgi:hypothetical protein
MDTSFSLGMYMGGLKNMRPEMSGKSVPWSVRR